MLCWDSLDNARIMEIPPLLEQLLTVTVENGASDLHIRSGRTPVIRLHGSLQSVDVPDLEVETVREMQEWLDSVQPVGVKDPYQLQRDVAIQHPELGRFRVSVFYERNRPAITFRHVKREIPELETLNLPSDLLRSLLRYPEGLILISGATGSGKSTTLAALLQDMGKRENKHVITLEDPIEYLFTDDHSVYTQREIGIDTEDFPRGLRAALRQDPDIIVIGELRDSDTFRVALRAAETGHLVISTTHAGNSSQTLERLLEFSTGDEVGLRRVSESLRGIVTQKLLPGMYGERVPALEFFRPGATSRDYIYRGDLPRIQDLLEESGEEGSFSFTTDLYRLVMEAKITKAVAMANCTNAKTLEMKLKGIIVGSGRTLD